MSRPNPTIRSDTLYDVIFCGWIKMISWVLFRKTKTTLQFKKEQSYLSWTRNICVNKCWIYFCKKQLKLLYFNNLIRSPDNLVVVIGTACLFYTPSHRSCTKFDALFLYSMLFLEKFIDSWYTALRNYELNFKAF